MESSYVLQLKNHPFPDMYLCFCGYEDCQPLHSFGPAVRPNYILHYILKGKGTFRAGGVVYELTAGQGFLIEPGVQTFYQADASEPWSYVWIGFDGARPAEYLAALRLGGSRLTYRSSQGGRILETVEAMLVQNTYTTVHQFMRQSLLYSFFSILSEDLDVISPPRGQDGSLYVRKAVEFIQNNYCYPIRVSDAADYVCINRSYLYTLFRRELGVSPQEYLANCRLTHAAELLVLTDFSVESVAFSCGYGNALVFSKAFKAKYGASPSQYRKEKLREHAPQPNR